MNKAELIRRLASRNDLTVRQSERVVNDMLGLIEEALAEGERVQLVSFGSFEVRERAPYLARNPRTNERIEIPATRTLIFKPGKRLKDRIAGEINGGWNETG